MFSRIKELFAGSPDPGKQPFTVFVVQHAASRDGLPALGLSQQGREQAAAFASSMKSGDIHVFIAGPARASVETAEVMQAAVGGELVVLDEFGGPAEEQSGPAPSQKGGEIDRPRGGVDASAADRFMKGLDVIRERYAPSRRVMVVSDGDRTLNALRTLRSDGEIEAEAPGTFEDGMPACAMTTFVWHGDKWDTDTIAALTIPDM